MLRSRHLVLAAAALFAAAVSPATAQTSERSALEWSFSDGDERYYQMSWILEIKSEMPGLPMPPQNQEFEIVYGLSERVTAVSADGSATIEATVASIRARMGMGMMGEVAFDSDSDAGAESPMRSLGAAVGQSFGYTRTKTGAVSNLTGMENVSSAIASAAAASIPEGGGQGGGGGGMGGGMGMDLGAMIPQLAAGMGSLIFSDQMMASGMSLMHHVLPSEAKSQGDTWTRPVTQTLPGIGSLQYDAEYTHQGSSAAGTRLSFRVPGEIEMVEPEANGAGDDAMSGMLEELMNSMSGNESEITRKAASGTATFGDGRLIDSEARQEVDSEGPLPAMVQMMLGEEAEGKRMQRNVALTLRLQEKEAPTGGGSDDTERQF
ncbi:DUF6263 family protein [Planctomycetota bacterium]|nr:DUF6263 family protein [Planctomycetota bacterium]